MSKGNTQGGAPRPLPKQLSHTTDRTLQGSLFRPFQFTRLALRSRHPAGLALSDLGLCPSFHTQPLANTCCCCVLVASGVADSVRPCGARQAPCPSASPGKNGVGGRFLLQGTLLTRLFCIAGRWFTAEPAGKPCWHLGILTSCVHSQVSSDSTCWKIPPRMFPRQLKLCSKAAFHHHPKATQPCPVPWLRPKCLDLKTIPTLHSFVSLSPLLHLTNHKALTSLLQQEPQPLSILFASIILSQVKPYCVPL